jgi:Asp-tRNA(Asn)/Glu-tRNA(Gln) amidotransferase C subunit
MSEPGAAPPSLTKETLRVLAQAQGFALSDADLDGLLPLVQAVRAMMDELAAVPLEDVEPTSLYHML